MYKVILVDDELVAVNALKNRINWQKYQVDEVNIARSIKQAQEIFRSHPIDIMLCDIEMPNGSGLELFEWVKGFYPSVECIYVSCHPDYHYIRQAMKLGSFDYVLKPVDYKELDGLMTQVIKRINEKKRNTHKQNQSFTSEEIESEIPEDSISITDDNVIQIREYIEYNIRNDICVNDIADYVHLSPIYVMRLFKSKTGKSIVEYITDLRIERAKVLLKNTAKSIQQVAEDVGYSNYSYFTRLFKKRTRMTPNGYRKHKKG